MDNESPIRKRLKSLEESESIESWISFQLFMCMCKEKSFVLKPHNSDDQTDQNG